MLDKKYCEGYEGEEQVKIWCDEGCEENGLLVWNVFFDAILEGCFKSEFQKGGNKALPKGLQINCEEIK